MARDLSLRVTLNAINKATGPLRQIMDGSRGAGRAIRETRDQLRDLNTQQRRITAFRDMSRQSHDTRRALMDKREELRQISRQLETTEGPTRRLTQQQENAQREVDKLSREYRHQRDSVRDLARELPPGIEGTRGLTEQNDALARQIEETNRRLNTQRDALDRLGRANVGGKFRNMTGEFRRFGRNVTLAGTIAAGSIFGLANSTATLGDDIAKTADLMGVGTQELQEMRYAAERAGVGTDSLDSSMQRMVRRIGRAAQGGGAAAKAYEELGLNARELADMDPSQALGVVADRLNDIENQTDRVAYASAIWGNNGEAMLNMIRGGSVEMEELYRQARQTGYALDEGASRNAEDFKDALLDAQLSVKGMKNTIGAELMPAVASLMREFTGWMRSNRHEVQAFAQEFGNRLRDAVPIIIELTQGAASFASTLANLVTRAADLAGGFDNLALILGGLFASKLIMSVVSFGISLWRAGAALATLATTMPGLIAGVRALGLAFTATPLGWVVAGITAVAAGAIYLWRNWETIGPKFAALWDQLRNLPGRAWAGIKEAFDDGIGGVTRLLLDWSPLGILWRGIRAGLSQLGIDLPAGLSELGGMMIDGLTSGIRNKLGELRESITGLGGQISGWFRDRLGINSPSRVFAEFGGNLLDGLINGIDAKWGVLRDKIGDTASAVTGWFKDRLGINSPSRVFADLGGDTMAGYQQGLVRNERGPLKEIGAFSKRLRQAGAGLALGAAAGVAVASPNVAQPGSGISIDSRPPMAAASSGGGVVIHGGINIEVNAAAGTDPQEISRTVAAEVERALERAARNQQARQRSAFHDID